MRVIESEGEQKNCSSCLRKDIRFCLNSRFGCCALTGDSENESAVEVSVYCQCNVSGDRGVDDDDGLMATANRRTLACGIGLVLVTE